MAGEYILFSDLRPDSLAEFASGLELPDSVVGDDALITSAIARMSQRFDDLTNDHFSTETGIVLTLSGDVSPRLYLPRRCTAVTSVAIVNYLGTSTVQTSTNYRLHSSLDAAGAERVTLGALDWLDLLPYKVLTGTTSAWGYGWPAEQGSVVVTGTFGWTVTPFDVKNAVAMMVYDHFKSKSDRIRRASSYQAGDASFVNNETGTGIKDVDDIVAAYSRDLSSIMVG